MDLSGTDTELRVRALNQTDQARLVAIDKAYTGRSRSAWYEGRLRRALQESDLRISLAAERDERLVGALMGEVHYGEYGQPEPVAVLDTILVDPDHAGGGVGRALMNQLATNLRALRIERIRTEVSWGEQSLIGFLARAGFEPVPRLVLEYDLSR